MNGLLRLNLGCGDRYAPGWHNIDHAGSPHRKDETVDLCRPLPPSWRNVSRVYAGHILEHLRIGDCLQLLDRLWRVVAPSGRLLVVGPDVVVAEEMAQAGTLDVTLDSLRYGAHRWPGDEHRWECSAGDVKELLWRTGWKWVRSMPIGEVPEEWPVADRGPTWQCAVLASPR